mmetsp:Transcript_72741/g.224999  ORF Transcript_72741/g.224999 Transcript_72741/m.224999 type:complete len:200 (+) Transcript_72741:459-1058(+)
MSATRNGSRRTLASPGASGRSATEPTGRRSHTAATRPCGSGHSGCRCTASPSPPTSTATGHGAAGPRRRSASAMEPSAGCSVPCLAATPSGKLPRTWTSKRIPKRTARRASCPAARTAARWRGPSCSCLAEIPRSARRSGRVSARCWTTSCTSARRERGLRIRTLFWSASSSAVALQFPRFARSSRSSWRSSRPRGSSA